MIWQDVVLAIGQTLFAIALIPALRSKQKPPKSTSALTGVTLLVFAVTFATLDLWWGAVTAAVCGGLWLILFCQRKIDVDDLEWRDLRYVGVDPASGPDWGVRFHAGCGGAVVKSHEEYESKIIPVYQCVKCGVQITDEEPSFPNERS